MKKFGINYSRPFPDHRVPYDYKFDQELTKSPSTYFRVQFLRCRCSSTPLTRQGWHSSTSG